MLICGSHFEWQCLNFSMIIHFSDDIMHFQFQYFYMLETTKFISPGRSSALTPESHIQVPNLPPDWDANKQLSINTCNLSSSDYLPDPAPSMVFSSVGGNFSLLIAHSQKPGSHSGSLFNSTSILEITILTLK